MATFIPEDKIQEVQHAADILEIVSESVALKKTGKNYQGLCPFHAEKTPSFSVNPGKQIFYCFGCGIGGNVFSFLMKKEGMGFPEAVRELAKRYGVQLPEPRLTPEQKRRIGEREQMLGVNRMAAAFFHQCLLGAGGDAARKYLHGRGFTDETIVRFHIGCAPDGWDHLSRFLMSKKVPLEIAKKVGLVAPRKSGNGYYDAFRNRVIFPIANAGKQVLGFGGRVLGEGHPKYLNSPETPVYNKRRSLYGIDQARQAAREMETVFVVEGYLDLLAMHQHGISNCVATLGTALTVEHTGLLRGLVGASGRVVLVFDSDAAGISASERSIAVFSSGYVNAHILVLPDGHDPDSFLFASGAEAFHAASQRSLDAVSFLMESAVKRHGMSLEGRLRAMEDMKKPLAAIEDQVARSLYVKTLSERLGIDEMAVSQKIFEVAAQGGSREGAGVSSRPWSSGQLKGGGACVGGRIRMERQIVAMMLRFSSIVEAVLARDLLSLFEDKTLRLLGGEVAKRREGTGAPAAFISSLQDPHLKAVAASLAIVDEQWSEASCHRLLNQFASGRRRGNSRLLNDIKAAEAAEDQETVLRLLKEKQLQARQSIKIRPKAI